MNLPPEKAAALWRWLCHPVVGAGPDGEEVESSSSLGIMAASHGVPTMVYTCNLSSAEAQARIIDPERQQVAAFLRSWADSLAGASARPRVDVELLTQKVVETVYFDGFPPAELVGRADGREVGSLALNHFCDRVRAILREALGEDD